MDRFDAWLNGQRGWRRFVLLWLAACPSAVLIGVGVMSGLASSSQAPGVAFIAVVAALSVIGAVPFAGLVLLLRSLYSRRARNRDKPLQQLLSWRFSLVQLILASAMMTSMLLNAEPYPWRYSHRELFLLVIVLLAAAALVSLWSLRYHRRISIRS